MLKPASYMTAPSITFSDLTNADLWIDVVDKGGSARDAGDDSLAESLPVGNQGGFRHKGSVTPFGVQMVVLYSCGNDPDFLDTRTDRLIYFSNNKTAGNELHAAARKGNLIPETVFERSRFEVTNCAGRSEMVGSRSLKLVVR